MKIDICPYCGAVISDWKHRPSKDAVRAETLEETVKAIEAVKTAHTEIIAFRSSNYLTGVGEGIDQCLKAAKSNAFDIPTENG